MNRTKGGTAMTEQHQTPRPDDTAGRARRRAEERSVNDDHDTTGHTMIRWSQIPKLVKRILAAGLCLPAIFPATQPANALTMAPGPGSQYNMTGRLGRLFTALAGALLCVVAAAAPAFARSQGAPSSTPQERAAAIATPSVVYLDIRWKGWLQLPGGSKWYGPFDAEATCSGFVANPTGYIVTAGHCVDNNSARDSGKDVIVQTAVQYWLDKGVINQADADSLLSQVDQFTVEGKQQNSLPARQVTVYQTVAASGAAGQRGTLAEVKDFSPFSQDDVALLKMETPTPMPASSWRHRHPPSALT